MKNFLFIAILVTGLFSFAETPTEYPRAEERTKMMANLAQVKETQFNLVIEDEPSAFLSHFESEVYPRLYEIKRLGSINAILSVALDRALYDNDEEKEAWKKEKREASVASSALSSSPEFKEAIKKWEELIQPDQKGSLTDIARRLAEEDRLQGFTQEQMPLVERLTELEEGINQASNESKVTGGMLSEYQKVLEVIEKDFRSGAINFTEATEKLDKVWEKGFHAKGHDVASSAYELLNEMAIVRTKMAQSKGFENWAQYALADNKFTHVEGLRSPEDHINFMSSVLEKTLPAHTAYKDWLIKQNPDIDPQSIDGRNSFLLSPENDTILSDYFPVDTVNEFWLQTMRESGFSDRYLNSINLDSFPRDNKQTHAYMWNVVDSQMKTLIVKDYEIQVATASEEYWNSAVIYIVQNARKNGLDAYSTVFHEGGHGLDFASRLNTLSLSESYAYSETASMTMERFFADHEFLLTKAQSKDGNKASAAQVNEYLKNSAMLEALGSRGQVRNALFDIAIWNEAYTEGGPKLVDRMREIYKETADKYFPGSDTPLPEGVFAGDRMFATSHFYSGNVRYYGYIYADMASQMTADYLWDHFEQTTGRRTFLNQPTLASILTTGQYQNGFELKFPLATESLTKKKFKPNALVDHINNKVKEFTQSENCSAYFELGR